MNDTRPSLNDCTLITRAREKSAQNLRELRNRIADVPVESLCHRFWETLPRPTFDDAEYRNGWSLIWGLDQTDKNPFREVATTGFGLRVGQEIRPNLARGRLMSCDAVAWSLEQSWRDIEGAQPPEEEHLP